MFEVISVHHIHYYSHKYLWAEALKVIYVVCLIRKYVYENCNKINIHVKLMFIVY
jgi:hypothetical protein